MDVSTYINTSSNENIEIKVLETNQDYLTQLNQK